MEHRYADFVYNRCASSSRHQHHQTLSTTDSEVSVTAKLTTDPFENLPYFYKKFIIIRNYGSRTFSKAKPCCILLLLFTLFLLLLSANFGLGYFLGYLFTIPDPISNSTAGPPTLLEANTSALSVKYSLLVPKTLPDDEVKYRIINELDKQLKAANLPNNYYKYTIDDIACVALKDTTKKCDIKSEVRFKQKIQFIDLEQALSLNDSALVDYANSVLNQPNTMDINAVVDFFNKEPLKNLDFVANASSLNNLNKKDLLSLIRDSGSLDYGSLCEVNEDCSTNMACVQTINDVAKRCRCYGAVAVFSSKSGFFECKPNIKLNYEDNCVSDSECQENSLCIKNRCACKAGLLFTRGTCVKSSVPEGNIQCKTDADCFVFTKLMKCVNNVCQCQMGYHMDNSLCGTVQIGSACNSQWDCGENTMCDDNKLCACTIGLESINSYDCVNTQITTSRIILHFIYQDRLKPPDEFDQIMFNVKNTYDQYLFNLSAKSTEFEAYETLQTEAYEYSLEKTQWNVRVTISFFQPIKLTLTLFDAVVEHLMQQKQFEVVTLINSQDYKQKIFVNYFAEIYLPKVQGDKLINDMCTIDSDCADSNAECVRVCAKADCVDSPNVCRCKNTFFESINLFDNNLKCALGLKYNDPCDSVNSCGENMQCSAKGVCECLPGFAKTGSTCISLKSLMPKVDGCAKNNDCPAFSKCQRGICVCFTSYEVINGLCKNTYAKIFLVASESCLGQTFCGQNAVCNKDVRTCKCFNNFQVIPPDNQNCEPNCC